MANLGRTSESSTLIDVIIPTFNRAKLIERAINSVLSQTYQNFKLYVVNDGSTDETEEILKSFAQHPKIYILKQENKGVSAARNLGIRHSDAPWLAFLDSDDEWLPEKLETQISYINDHPDCRFVHSDEIWIRNGVRVNAPKKFDKSNIDIFRRSLETCLISPSTVMIKRDLCLEHNCFDEKFAICEDYELWLKILAFEKVGFIAQELIKKYGGHDDQLSTSYFAMDLWRIKALSQLLKFANLSSVQQKQVSEVIDRKSQQLMAGYLKHKNTEGLAELLKINPSLR